MSRSLELFYTDVLGELGVTGPDRTASAEDLAVVEDAYPALWNLLDVSGLTSWTQTADIPDEVVLPLRWIMAYHIAGQFGVYGPRLERLAGHGMLGGPQPSVGERMLTRMASPDYISSTLAVDYY